MTYKVGDYVRVRLDLDKSKIYILNERMMENRGKALKVTEIARNNHYLLEDGYYYCEDMIEPVDNLKVGDKVRIRKDLADFPRYRKGITRGMVDIAGEEHTVDSIVPNELGFTGFRIGDGKVCSYLWLSKWLDKIERKEERVNQKTYSLTQNKNTTVLLKKENGKVVSRGIAKCMDGDNFDENFGIIMAAIKLAIKSKNKLTVSQVEELRRTLCGAISEESLKESYDNMMEGFRDFLKEAFLEGGLK